MSQPETALTILIASESPLLGTKPRAPGIAIAKAIALCSRFKVIIIGNEKLAVAEEIVTMVKEAGTEAAVAALELDTSEKDSYADASVVLTRDYGVLDAIIVVENLIPLVDHIETTDVWLGKMARDYGYITHLLPNFGPLLVKASADKPRLVFVQPLLATHSDDFKDSGSKSVVEIDRKEVFRSMKEDRFAPDLKLYYADAEFTADWFRKERNEADDILDTLLDPQQLRECGRDIVKLTEGFQSDLYAKAPFTSSYQE